MDKSGWTRGGKKKKEIQFRNLSLSKTQLGREDKEQHFKVGKYLWINEWVIKVDYSLLPLENEN